MRKNILWIVLVALAVGLPATAQETKPKYQWHPIQLSLVEETNRARQAHGLRPLEIDPRIMISAMRHTAWMVNGGGLRHGRGPYAENIAYGPRTSRGAVQMWLGSRGHRANMLNPGWRRIGVMAYRTSGGTVYWTQQFAR